jgi:hypothetical protein
MADVMLSKLLGALGLSRPTTVQEIKPQVDPMVGRMNAAFDAVQQGDLSSPDARLMASIMKQRGIQLPKPAAKEAQTLAQWDEKTPPQEIAKRLFEANVDPAEWPRLLAGEPKDVQVAVLKEVAEPGSSRAPETGAALAAKNAMREEMGRTLPTPEQMAKYLVGQPEAKQRQLLNSPSYPKGYMDEVTGHMNHFYANREPDDVPTSLAREESRLRARKPVPR